jgi:hypothetical protein
LVAIGILVLTPPGFELSPSDVYDTARAILERETLLEIAPYDVFSESMRQDAVRTCANDPSCFLERFLATGTRIDLLLVATVAEVVREWRVGLRLIDAKGSSLGQLGGECDRSTLGPAMNDLLARLIPSTIWGQLGSIEVITDPPGARAELGAKSCFTPCRFDRIAPGEHAILFRREGFVAQRAAVNVKARDAAKVELALAPEVEPSKWYEGPWLWIGIGIGVAAAGAGVGIYFLARDRPDDVCITGDPGDC